MDSTWIVQEVNCFRAAGSKQWDNSGMRRRRVTVWEPNYIGQWQLNLGSCWVQFRCVPPITNCGTRCWVHQTLPPPGPEQTRSWPAKGGHHWQLSTVVHIPPRQCGQWHHAYKPHPFHISTTSYLLHILNPFHSSPFSFCILSHSIPKIPFPFHTKIPFPFYILRFHILRIHYNCTDTAVWDTVFVLECLIPKWTQFYTDISRSRWHRGLMTQMIQNCWIWFHSLRPSTRWTMSCPSWDRTASSEGLKSQVEWHQQDKTKIYSMTYIDV